MPLIKSLILTLLLVVGLFGPAYAQGSGDDLKELQRLLRVAQVAEQENRIADAIKAYQTMAVVAKNSPKLVVEAKLSISDLYMTVGKFEEAAAVSREAIALDPNSAEAYNNLGEALGELKQFKAALEAFQRATNLNGNLLKARYNMGVTYDRLGQLKYAEFIYRILIRDHRDFALGFDSLAVVLSRTGRASEAIQLHERAIGLNPNDPSFYYNYGVSCMVLGDVRKAQEQQKRLRDLDPAMAEQLATVIAKHK
jgi:tetratricopeptide (TPR) repeat protein